MEKGMQSLFNEMKIMRAVTKHPNVIQLNEVYEGDNTYYFVMELSEGNSLYDEIKKHSDLMFTYDEVQSITKDLICGIQYLSKSNIMHRDLKPENLLFKHKNSLK